MQIFRAALFKLSGSTIWLNVLSNIRGGVGWVLVVLGLVLAL